MKKLFLILIIPIIIIIACVAGYKIYERKIDKKIKERDTF